MAPKLHAKIKNHPIYKRTHSEDVSERFRGELYNYLVKERVDGIKEGRF